MAEGDHRQLTELPIAEALPAMQALASRTWTPESRQHPGQLAWSYAYGTPEDLAHGPTALLTRDDEVVAWAWAESDDWMELCVDPAALDAGDAAVAWFLERTGDGVVRTMALDTEEHVIAALDRAGFVVEEEAPWFTHHLLDLADLVAVPEVPGYTFRHVEPGEAAARAACHRAAWTPPGGTSKVSTAAYERLMATPPYRHDLDWVALDAHGEMVASAMVWLDPVTGGALVEPVGCAPEHRGHGLAGAVSIAALRAARDLGGRLGLVCPRGDDAYPVPMRIYSGSASSPALARSPSSGPFWRSERASARRVAEASWASDRAPRRVSPPRPPPGVVLGRDR
ncbi:MAG: GNAT family N-acetyltransferase [Nocardioides sp.]